MDLLAFPNVSEGRDGAVIEGLLGAFAPARVLDVHTDADHDRTAITLAGRPGELAGAVARGAEEVVARVRLDDARGGVHPRVGALDVAPIVWPGEAARGAACAEALVLADALGRAGLPVFLYGELAGGRTRAELRRGGTAELARRVAAGELAPDFGPSELHPTAGATLVAARPPLVAFNLVVDASLERAHEVARAVRTSLPEVRALGLQLPGQEVVQVSMNVERPDVVPLRDVVATVAQHARVVSAELVGLAPAAALEGLPADLSLDGATTIERALAG